MLGIPEAEMKQVVRDIVMRMVVRKAAEGIVERSCKDLTAQAATTPISVNDIKEAYESLFEEVARRKKVIFHRASSKKEARERLKAKQEPSP
jgi:hypothetical protein